MDIKTSYHKSFVPGIIIFSNLKLYDNRTGHG